MRTIEIIPDFIEYEFVLTVNRDELNTLGLGLMALPYDEMLQVNGRLPKSLQDRANEMAIEIHKVLQ